MKFFLGIISVLIALCCTGCGGVQIFPKVQQDWKAFIPSAENAKEEPPRLAAEIRQQDEQLIQTLFPDKCVWAALERVIDGDTILLKNGKKVRFIGIDAPETKHPEKAVDPLGLIASKALFQRISQEKEVCLLYDLQGEKEDTYERLLAYIFLRDGTDVNRWLLEEGFVKPYLFFPFVRKEAFRLYGEEAREKQKGLWAG